MINVSVVLRPVSVFDYPQYAEMVEAKRLRRSIIVVHQPQGGTSTSEKPCMHIRKYGPEKDI